MATGSYPFKCGDLVLNVDVRGVETKILDRTMREDRKTGEVLLIWKAASSGEIPCRWSVEVLPPDEEGYLLAEGNITLKGEWGDYMVRVVPEDDEPCDFVLRLEADVLSATGEPLAVIRYSRSENTK